MRPKRYFPFAEGPRNCVGQNLAKVSLLGTMATLMQHFSFRLADEVINYSPVHGWVTGLQPVKHGQAVLLGVYL